MHGRFEVREMLGAGGMGRVHRAFDRARQEVVALKSLRRAGASDIERFKREFRSLTDLSHPNLVTLHELFATDEGWFFTMELVDGHDLVDHVRGRSRDEGSTGSTREMVAPTMPAPDWADGVLEEPPTAELCRDLDLLRWSLRQLVEGLLALHDSGRVHGDVKPSNVLVTARHRVVLLDFGLAVETQPPRGSRPSATIIGTPPYMAPEQLAGHPPTTASDWYAVGVLLYEALTGRLPFEGPTAKVMLDKQMREPPRVSEVVPGVPGDLALACEGLLARDARYRMDGREVLALLGAKPSGEITGVRDARRLQGRDDALGALRDAFLDTRRGESVSVVVHGASGVGKSALLRAFVADLPPDVIVLQGRCYEHESVPFKGLDEVVDALASTLAAMPDAATILPSDVQPLVRIFPALARAEACDVTGDHRTGAPAADQRGRAFAAFRELLRRIAATRGVVIAIDDTQWGDGDGAALLAELLAPPDAPAVMVVVACRSEDRDASALVRALRGARELALGPLAREHARILAAHLLAERAVDDALVDRVVRASSGHPLLLSELARHLRTSSGSPPADLAGMVRDRVERLPAPARRVLELVAIAGRPLRERVVRDAASVADDDAPVILATLRAERLVRVRRDGIECHHDHVRVAVIESLTAADRRAHHRRLADVLAARAETEPEALVEHLRSAGDVDGAARYALSAGERAASALAFDRAAAHYQLAVELGAASPEVWERLGDAHMVLGAHGPAGHAYGRADSAPAAPRDRVRRLRKRATVAQKLGHYAAALALCRDALAIVDDPDDLGAAAVEALAALTCCFAGELAEGMEWADRAEARLAHNRAPGAARATVVAALHRARGNLLLELGRPLDAADEYLLGIAPCDALDDRWERSIALFNIGEALEEAGDHTGALRYLEAARVEKAQIGDRWGLGYTWLVMARVHAAVGDRARALECARIGRSFTLDVADPKLASMLHATTARLARAQLA